ncbi:hypothetical protein Daesc_001871 [Daldinia eschscholtzii]|uniref:Uncharacterized protein n=1 Tax=Daldinia eschscholtzii TaxID=292717 RepID=A0AAX6MWP2_9PEZI
MGRFRRFAKAVRHKFSQRFNDTQSTLGTSSYPSAQSSRSPQSIETADVATSDDSEHHDVNYLRHFKTSDSSAGTTSTEDAESPPSLPEPPSQFISYLDQNQGDPTRALLQPYLGYEKWLRHEFVNPDAEIDCYSNLVPVFNGQESLFKIRTIDYLLADKSRYLMPLQDHQREEDNSLAIVESLEKYQCNFDGFTRDWSNIVVAGSSALLPLLSRRKDVDIEGDPAVEKPAETYYQIAASTSDIDIFLYGIDDEEAAVRRIVEVENVIRKNQNLFPNTALALRSENAITFIAPKWPFRHVQHNFEVYWDSLDRLRVKSIDIEEYDMSHRYLTGLARLIFSEAVLRKKAGSEWKKNRNLRKLDDSRGPMAVESLSGYANHILPYGLTLTARSVRLAIKGSAENPYMFGTIQEVTDPTNKKCKWKLKNNRRVKLTKKVTFIKLNPGRQMIGSFYPRTADDWTKMAYE